MKKALLWALFPFVPLLLSSCTSVRIDVSYDTLGMPTTCTAYYGSLFKQADAAEFAVCHGTAEVVESRPNTELLGEILKAVMR